MKRLISNSILAATCVLIAPATVQAQLASCNASVAARTLTPGPFEVGETIAVQMELGAETIDGGTYLDIDKFSVFLDCTAGDTFPVCTIAGNTVSFLGVTGTTCTDNDASPAASTFTIDGPTPPDVEVTFLPDPDPAGAVRLLADSSCTVDFEISVDALAETNSDQEIVELFGFAEIDGSCDNGDNGGDGTSIAFTIPVDNEVSRFRVNKTFSDGFPGEAKVYLVCNAGNKLMQEFTLTDGGTVEFQIAGFTPGNMNCDIYEDPIPGYEPDYNAFANDGVAADIYDDDDGCHYDGVESGDFECDITNLLEPVPLVINKNFFFGDDDVTEQFAEIDVFCENYLPGPFGPVQAGGFFTSYTVDGDNTNKFFIYPNWDEPATRCRALETVMTSGVESDQGCNDWIELTVDGDGGECTITNSVFYEGIPTLSQKGIALLALLMLGLGAVGIRRFI